MDEKLGRKFGSCESLGEELALEGEDGRRRDFWGDEKNIGRK